MIEQTRGRGEFNRSDAYNHLRLLANANGFPSPHLTTNSWQPPRYGRCSDREVAIRFSLSSTILVVALAAVLVDGLAFYGQQAMFVVTLPVLCLIGLWLLLRNRRMRSAAILATLYLILRMLTATIGAKGLKQEVQKFYNDNSVPSVLEIVRQDPNYGALPVSIQSSLVMNTPGPWYYFEVSAVPCPLTIVTEEGAVSRINSGPGGRKIILWSGLNYVEISWYCYWWMD